MKHLITLIILSLLLTACTKVPEPEQIVESVKMPQVTLYESDVSYTIDATDIQGILDYINTKQRYEQIPASISEDYSYVPTQNGNIVDTSKLIEDVRNGKLSINIEDYYINPTVSNEQILKELSESILGFQIQYDNGDTISANDCKFTVSSDYTVLPDKESLNKCVQNITLKYDTVGKSDIQYQDINGNSHHVTGGTWGTLSDTLLEEEYVYEKALELSSELNRTPIMKEECQSEIPSRIIEVNIPKQQVTVVQDGDIISQSDVVTGLPPKRSTPTGVFKVLEKRKEKDLRGPGYVSHVHRWMRLTWSGVGLHDATWRSRFGGSIYQHDGSHGCINLPKSYAYDLYENVNVGDCVIIYND